MKTNILLHTKSVSLSQTKLSLSHIKSVSLSQSKLSLSHLMRQSLLLLFISTTLFLTLSCGSKPKREMEITVIHSNAKEMLESANASILSGEYDKAEYFLDQAAKLSMTVDDYDLLTSVALAYVSLDLSYNPPQTQKAEENLSKAKVYASYSIDPDKNTALCALSEARIIIATQNEKADYSSLIRTLEKHQKVLKNDPYNEAQLESTMGDIYRVQKNYSEAEASYTKAAKLYTDNRYLSEIGITWYKIAQVRSLNNKKQPALEALEKAIFYDRAAENTLALGTDYYVKGIILLKGTPSAAEKTAAKYAFTHSAEIFTAAGTGMEAMAQKSLDAAAEIE